MGADVPVDLGAGGTRTFTIRVAGTQHLERVEILRNNRVVFDLPFSGRPATEDWDGRWTDAEPLEPLAIAPTFPGDRPFVFYYLRVSQRNRQRAWSSPIWLTQRPDGGAGEPVSARAGRAAPLRAGDRRSGSGMLSAHVPGPASPARLAPRRDPRPALRPAALIGAAGSFRSPVPASAGTSPAGLPSVPGAAGASADSMSPNSTSQMFRSTSAAGPARRLGSRLALPTIRPRRGSGHRDPCPYPARDRDTSQVGPRRPPEGSGGGATLTG